MKKRSEKEVIVADLRDRFSKQEAAILTGYRGLTVAQLEELRDGLKKAGGTYLVIKNTLARIAAKGTKLEGLIEKLDGPNALVFAPAEAVTTVKAILDFQRKSESLRIISAHIEGKEITKEELKDYGALPTKTELRAQFLSTLEAPLNNFVSVLSRVTTDLVGTLKSYEDKLASGEQEAAEEK